LFGPSTRANAKLVRLYTGGLNTSSCGSDCCHAVPRCQSCPSRNRGCCLPSTRLVRVGFLLYSRAEPKGRPHLRYCRAFHGCPMVDSSIEGMVRAWTTPIRNCALVQQNRGSRICGIGPAIVEGHSKAGRLLTNTVEESFDLNETEVEVITLRRHHGGVWSVSIFGITLFDGGDGDRSICVGCTNRERIAGPWSIANGNG